MCFICLFICLSKEPTWKGFTDEQIVDEVDVDADAAVITHAKTSPQYLK